MFLYESFRMQSCFTWLKSKHSGGQVSSVYILGGNEKGTQKHFLCVSQSVTWWKERTMWRWTERYSRSLLLRSLSALKTTTSTSTTPPQLVVAASDSSERSLLWPLWLVFSAYKSNTTTVRKNLWQDGMKLASTKMSCNILNCPINTTRLLLP